ncbi:MAG TPA: dihydropteroate synthase [Polyangiales bacterium]|nr:dihydropteroate synthase [Polyangiales bacterium]
MLNVTPDSFSDGGEAITLDAALDKAKRLLAEGADVIDVGGASSRPPGKTYGAGAPVVTVDEELERVVPVVRALVRLGARVSVDTTRPEVARAGLAAGASIINDVSNGASEPLLEAVASASAELVLMHNRGDGSQSSYTNVVDEVTAELSAAAVRAACAGVAFKKIWVDPGIGFAKSPSDSLVMLAAMPRVRSLGYRVLVGPSRKSFIAALERAAGAEESPPNQRLGGTAAAVTACVLAGVNAVRVHDVKQMRQAVILAEALRAGSGGAGGFAC